MGEALNRITYVEDEPDIRAVIELTLKEVGGFTLDVCCDGQEALNKTASFKPQMIMLDVMMPGIDGVETMRALRRNPETARIPVVFMTAKAQRHEIEFYKDLGAIEVIAKPFDPMTLSDQLNTIWDRYNEEEATRLS